MTPKMSSQKPVRIRMKTQQRRPLALQTMTHIQPRQIRVKNQNTETTPLRALQTHGMT